MVIEKHGWVSKREGQFQLWCGRTTTDDESVSSDWGVVTCDECRRMHDRLVRLVKSGGEGRAGIESRMGGATAPSSEPAQEEPPAASDRPSPADAGPDEYTVDIRMTAQQARELLERLRELIE
jgi:hypothetical protein